MGGLTNTNGAGRDQRGFVSSKSNRQHIDVTKSTVDRTPFDSRQGSEKGRANV